MSIDVGIVEDFLATLTETEAGPAEWPEYQALLDAISMAGIGFPTDYERTLLKNWLEGLLGTGRDYEARLVLALLE